MALPRIYRACITPHKPKPADEGLSFRVDVHARDKAHAMRRLQYLGGIVIRLYLRKKGVYETK